VVWIVIVWLLFSFLACGSSNAGLIVFFEAKILGVIVVVALFLEVIGVSRFGNFTDST